MTELSRRAPTRDLTRGLRATASPELTEAAEGDVANIVGHVKQSMTYWPHSGGASLAVKRYAIEKLDSPNIWSDRLSIGSHSP